MLNVIREELKYAHGSYLDMGFQNERTGNLSIIIVWPYRIN